MDVFFGGTRKHRRIWRKYTERAPGCKELSICGTPSPQQSQEKDANVGVGGRGLGQNWSK
jgi:hypothetical protein